MIYTYILIQSLDWTGRQHGRRPTSRTRRRQAHLETDLFDDSQGNNYEV